MPTMANVKVDLALFVSSIHGDRGSLEATRREIGALLQATDDGRRRIRKTNATGEGLFADTTPEGRQRILEMIRKYEREGKNED